MRVLLVTDFFLPVRGGLEVHVDSLATELAEAGADVHVATLTARPRPSHPDVRVHTIKAPGVHWLPHVDESRPFAPPCPEPTARRGLTALVRELAPDVIHGHSWLAMSLPADTRAPLVYTAHDYGLICHLHTLWRWPGAICDGPGLSKCIRCGTKYGSAPVATAMTVGLRVGRSMLLPSAVIAISEAIRRAVEPYVPAPVTVVSSYMGGSTASPPPAGDVSCQPSALPLVMYAGDPGEHKGVDDLIALWREPDPPEAELLLALTRTDRRALPPRVRVVHLHPSEMLDAWRKATVAVVPSRWSEPLGMTAHEAMAAGLPVIVTAVGGLVEVVADGVNGIHIPPSDPASLRRALDRLLGDEALRKRLGVAAQAAASKYSAAEQAARIVDVYRSVLVGR